MQLSSNAWRSRYEERQIHAAIFVSHEKTRWLLQRLAFGKVRLQVIEARVQLPQIEMSMERKWKKCVAFWRLPSNQSGECVPIKLFWALCRYVKAVVVFVWPLFSCTIHNNFADAYVCTCIKRASTFRANGVHDVANTKIARNHYYIIIINIIVIIILRLLCESETGRQKKQWKLAAAAHWRSFLSATRNTQHRRLTYEKHTRMF